MKSRDRLPIFRLSPLQPEKATCLTQPTTVPLHPLLSQEGTKQTDTQQPLRTNFHTTARRSKLEIIGRIRPRTPPGPDVGTPFSPRLTVLGKLRARRTGPIFRHVIFHSRLYTFTQRAGYDREAVHWSWRVRSSHRTIRLGEVNALIFIR